MALITAEAKAALVSKSGKWHHHHAVEIEIQFVLYSNAKKTWTGRKEDGIWIAVLNRERAVVATVC